MGLKNGSQLGIYTIVGPLGAGGMGEVYRARDTKLDREVAIKVIPDAMAYDKERVARFDREAKVLASLNHPMIAAIYGFDEAEGKRFLVLELVEGPTLADRLAKGRLPVEESLDIAKQTAEALEVAHEKGIIHRDLKPANIKVTSDGQVKVLDFGLAKAMAEEDTSIDPGASPTITKDFTMPGVILGTAAYMSPEQARGRPVDKRSDIWSFGCVLYECLTGDSMFRGETVTDSIGAILHKQPDWDLLPADTPPTVQLLLRRCLAKDRKRRLRDIGDVRIELEAAIADPTSSALGLARSSLVVEGKATLWSSRGIGTIASAMIFTLLATLGVNWSLQPPPPIEPPPPPIEKYSITVPQRESQLAISWPIIAASADGQFLSYIAEQRPDDGKRNVFLRQRDQILPFTVVEGVGRITFPTFSPVGKWLAYYSFSRKELLKVPFPSGPTGKLCECNYATGLTWTDGQIYFSERGKSNVFFRVGENGGTPEEIQLTSSGTGYVNFLHAVPDGQSVLYALAKTSDSQKRANSSIEVYSFQSGKSKRLVENGTFPLYSKSGHLLFLRDSTLMAASYDSKTLELTSEPVPAVEGIGTFLFESAAVAIDDHGTLYYRLGEARTGETPPKMIYQLKLEDGAKPKVFSDVTGRLERLSIAKDEKHLAIEISDENDETRNISLYEIERKLLRELTDEPGGEAFSVFSPDGKWVYYSARDKHDKWLGIFRRRRDHSGGAELVYQGPRECTPRCFSFDGKSLFVDEWRAEHRSPRADVDIGVLRLGENGDLAVHEQWNRNHRKGRQTSPAISPPNGEWVAFDSRHEGGQNIYVLPISGEGALYRVSKGDGDNPFWSPDGKTLYYSSRISKGVRKSALVAANVVGPADTIPGDDGLTFKVGNAKPVSDLLDGIQTAQLMPDGKSVLFIAEAPKEGEEDVLEEPLDDPAVIHVTRNFFTKLEELAPTKKKSTEKEAIK